MGVWVFMGAGLCGSAQAEGGATSEGPRMGVPSFWEGSIAVGMTRTTWTYYMVSNIPKASVLHVPVLPSRPQNSPHWPKDRLDAPRVVDTGEGTSVLVDPQVERAKASWQARLSAWISQRTGLDRLWQWLRALPKGGARKPAMDPDIVFLPDITAPEVTASKIYRYSPPDEFVQFLAGQSLFINRDADEVERAGALERARKDNKFLFVLDRNSRPRTVHNEQWRMDWTVHVRPDAEEPKEVVSSPDQANSPEIKRRSPTPGSSGEQLDRFWTVLRQTDLATGRSVDELVDQAGESGLLWPVGRAGARMEIWHSRWGTMQWNLVSAQSIAPDGKPMGWGPPLRPVVYESQAQSLAVTGGILERPMVAWWMEDVWGQAVTGMGGMELMKGPAWRMASVPPHEGWMRAVLWALIDGRWQWIALQSCQVRPIPQAEVDWPEGKPVPQGGQITLRGRFFTPGIGLRLSVGGKVVREWPADRADWQAAVDLSGHNRRTVVAVETQAPWKSASEIPSAWPWVRIASRTLTIQ